MERIDRRWPLGGQLEKSSWGSQATARSPIRRIPFVMLVQDFRLLTGKVASVENLNDLITEIFFIISAGTFLRLGYLVSLLADHLPLSQGDAKKVVKRHDGTRSALLHLRRVGEIGSRGQGALGALCPSGACRFKSSPGDRALSMLRLSNSIRFLLLTLLFTLAGIPAHADGANDPTYSITGVMVFTGNNM